MSLIDDIVKAIEAREKKPRGYDSEAKVVRIDGDTAYVHLPGGVPETPVKRTISCKVGDKVQVRVSGGRATITGNATAPPTDDTKAEAADGKAVEAEKTAQSALEKALEGIKLTDAQAERLTSFFSEFIKDNLIRAEKIDADSLHVKAANVDGTLTAGQINGDGLSVKNGTFEGSLSAATGSFSGDVTAQSGKIGKFTLSDGWLTYGSTSIAGDKIMINQSPTYSMLVSDGLHFFNGGVLATSLGPNGLEGKVFNAYNEAQDPIGSSTVSGGQTYTIQTHSSTAWIWGECGEAGAHKYLKISGTLVSDVRLKKNISDSNVNALDAINKIKVRAFDWKETGKHQKIGMVADEVEEIDPELAKDGGYAEDGEIDVKYIDTNYLIGYLVKSIQELSAKVSELEAKLNVNHNS